MTPPDVTFQWDSQHPVVEPKENEYQITITSRHLTVNVLCKKDIVLNVETRAVFIKQIVKRLEEQMRLAMYYGANES